MKLKKVLILSLIVNAVFLAAVGYMNATEIKPNTTTPIVIFTTNAAVASLSSLAAAR
jgi:hypothetical protein